MNCEFHSTLEQLKSFLLISKVHAMLKGEVDVSERSMHVYAGDSQAGRR